MLIWTNRHRDNSHKKGGIMRDSGYENQMIQLNYDLAGHKKGSKVKIRTKDGIPVNPYWRERLIDSRIDKCIEYVSKAKTEETKEIEKEIETQINITNNRKKRKET